LLLKILSENDEVIQLARFT